MKLNNILPTVSVIVPVFNEEVNLRRLFSSLRNQTYPKSKIEYIIVDDASTDNTYKLAKEFGARIISVETHDIELNKGIGLHKAQNELVYWLDADMEILSNNFFEKLTQPLVENEKLIGSFTNEFCFNYQKPVNSLLRFISYDPLQRDPVYRFFSTSIEDTIIEKSDGYFICKFLPGKIPPSGRMIYRRRKLLQSSAGKSKSFIDLETLEILSREGHQLFGYAPQAQLIHYHIQTLQELIKKRVRNLNRDYLPNIDKKYYTWFNINEKKGILRIVFWIIYANLFFPELIIGLVKIFRHKDLAFLWQPIVSFVVTDAVLLEFISKPSGRYFIIKVIKKLVS